MVYRDEVARRIADAVVDLSSSQVRLRGFNLLLWRVKNDVAQRLHHSIMLAVIDHFPR